MKHTIWVLALLILGCNQPPNQNTSQLESESLKIVSKISKSDHFKVIHVFVALCDNEHQGIQKVPSKIGNGQDSENNLYWGCDLGTKTFLKNHKDWQLVQTSQNPKENVLERCLFKHKATNTLLVADAYDGEFIKKCTSDFLQSCSGNFNDTFVFGKDSIACGGSSDLLSYIGHDGLMEFRLDDVFAPKDTLQREAIILACISKSYFEPYLKQTGAKPLIWTTGLMAPEAYTLVEAIDKWILKKDKNIIREAAAQAYHQYQKCGIKAARNLLVNE